MKRPEMPMHDQLFRNVFTGLCLVLACAGAHADVVVLKSGEKISGQLVSANAVNVILLQNGTEAVFPRSAIRAIGFESAKTSDAETTSGAGEERIVAGGQTVRLRVSSWSLPTPESPGVFGVHYQLLNDLQLSGKERLLAGSVAYGTVVLSKVEGRRPSFTKNLTLAYEPTRMVRLTHGKVSPLRSLGSGASGATPVTFSAGDPVPTGSDSSPSKDLPWLKVGSLVEWDFTK
jgi:hypothetical protein